MKLSTGVRTLSKVLDEATDAAVFAYRSALSSMSPAERCSSIGPGADGTETYLLDEVVEAPVLDVLERQMRS